MKQTTLAFLAVLMITLYSANQQRSLIHAQNGRYAREIEMAATDLALAKLAEIGRLAFDEGDADGDQRIRLDVDGLTDADDFGPDGQEAAPADPHHPYDDVDDYHGLRANVAHALNDETFAFRLDVRVAYAEVEGVTSADEDGLTLAKRVTVRVRSDRHAGLPVDVALDRTLTPALLALN